MPVTRRTVPSPCTTPVAFWSQMIAPATAGISMHMCIPVARQDDKEAGDSVRTMRRDRQFCELADNSCGSALSPPSCDSESQVMATVDSLGFSPPAFAAPLLKTDDRNPHDRDDVPSTPPSHASHCEPGRCFTESQKISKRLRKGKSGISEGCDGRNTCNSCHSEGNSLGTEKLKESPSASMFSDLSIRRMSTQVMKVFKRKMRRFKEARPETVFKMLTAFESYANVVQLEVKAPFGTSSCFCCAKPLCQSYAVMYSQFKEFSYRVLHHLVAHYIATRHHANQEMATVTRQYKKISMTVAEYIVRRARMMEKLGFPQNEEAIKRLEKEQKPPDRKDKEASSSYSYGSLDSLDLSGNNPAQFAARKGVSMPRSGFRRRGARPRRHRGKHYAGFQFGKRKAHHGLIMDWSHVPYPFTPTLLPPVRIRWGLYTVGICSRGEADSRRHERGKTDTNPLSKESDVDLVPDRDKVDMTTTSDKPDMGQPTTETTTKDARTTFSDASEAQNVPGVEPAAETKPVESAMKNILLLDSEGSPGPFEKGLHKLVKRMLRHSMREVDREAGWVLGLKESLASVVAFARLDVLKEVQDPMKVAIRNFTHALLVLLFEELLPKEEEESFVVTPDDIRQRRKRVSSKRSPGLFDLTENNHPGYDLDLLDFVVVKLCERWELGKVEFQHQPTLEFLTRCLTMDSLDSDLMKQLDELVLTPHKGDIQGLFLDRMTHVHETQHSLAVVANEVMAMTLVYVVPETLKAMQDVTGWLKNEEERVAYVCEKVTVMENQVRHKLSRRMLRVAAEDVQDQLIVFARRQEKITQRSEKMINKLRELVKEDYYYTCLKKDELLPIKKELTEIRHMVNTIHRVYTFEQARKVKRYAENTSKLQDVKVREALSSLTDTRHTEKDYSRRQLAEVEWLMTGQNNKYFPAACMEFALLFMFLATVVNLILVTILGASFSPKVIGEWFGQFLLITVFMILVSEPIKCLWLLDYGWKQPE